MDKLVKLKHGLAASLIASAVGLFETSSSFAAIIFQDDFNRSNANGLGNGWTEIEETASGVELSGNAMRLRGQQSGVVDAQAAQLVISTVGLDTITLGFDWAALSQSEAADTLLVEWRAASGAWTTLTGISLFSTDLGDDSGAFAHQTVSLSPGTDNLTNIEFRFRIAVDVNCCTGASASRQNEGALIDNVLLQGSTLADFPVLAAPEPATLAIFGVALAGLGFYRNRRGIRLR